MLWRIFGYALVALSAGLAVFVLYRNSAQSNVPLQYSPSQTLGALWNQYKTGNLEPGTYRTLDKQRGNITTSEGESYTMLRAVWMGDKQTFDASWSWTKANLSRPDDHLFSWLWGQRPNGTYGVLTDQNGQNSASDADTNIALALAFAYARWQDPAYLDAARSVAGDIWDLETVTIGGKAYVLADNLEKGSLGPALVNPSYLEPAAYRVFAKIDPAHPWQRALDGSYRVLAESATLPLGATTSADLPPDWISLDKETGALSAPAAPVADTNFGYDALRVPWNLALDYAWSRDPRDAATAGQFSLLAERWQSSGRLVAAYRHDGSIAPDYAYETPAMYGGAIGYFMLAAPRDAGAVYAQKLAYLFTPDWSGWRQELSYYDDNWAWFGIGLYAGLLPDLTAGLPASFFAQQA